MRFDIASQTTDCGDSFFSACDSQHYLDDVSRFSRRLRDNVYVELKQTSVCSFVHSPVKWHRQGRACAQKHRLLQYEIRDGSATGTLLRTVYYTYWQTGDVSNITIADENDPLIRKDLPLYYAKSGQLWMAVSAEWDLDETTFEYVEDSYEILSAREFRGGGRRRYLSREVDPALDWQPASSATQQWTDYLGDVPWGDFVATADDGPTTVSMRYGAAGGAFAQQHMSGGSGGSGGTTGEVRYLHGDLIDSTMLVTNSSGAAPSSGDGSPGTVQYTAFGEILTPPGTGGGAPGGEAPSGFPRYQYAGGWGYESGLLALFGADSSLPPITLQHVGARWYQPEIGRFVQRDPSGIKDGPNTYSYVQSDPIGWIDSDGLQSSRPGRWIDTGKYGRRYYKDGKFAKPPWWQRTLSTAGKGCLIFMAGKIGARGICRATGQPYEDPEDIVMDILFLCIDRGLIEAQNAFQRGAHPGSFPPRWPAPEPRDGYPDGIWYW